MRGGEVFSPFSLEVYLLIIAILAGGKGTRFGGEKLLYPMLSDGKALIDVVYEKVSILGMPVYIISGDDKKHIYISRGYDVLVDNLLIGPIGGILTALSYDDALVVGGDMPLIDEGLLKDIIRTGEYGKKTVVPSHSGGLLEPLCALYSRSIYDDMKKYVKGGGRSIQYFLKSSGSYVPYPVKDLIPFYNINTKEDLKNLTVYEDR